MLKLKKYITIIIIRVCNLKNWSLLKYCINRVFSRDRGTFLIGNFTRIKSMQISYIGKEDSIVEIGSNCYISGIKLMLSEGSKIIIGNNVFINGTKSHPVILNAVEGQIIHIGDGCIISNRVEMHTSDYHSLLDMQHSRTNYSKSIYIGNHVWIGLRTVILKGVHIPSNCIVGACSLVTGKFTTSNCLLAGVPAKIIRENVDWNIKLL